MLENKILNELYQVPKIKMKNVNRVRQIKNNIINQLVTVIRTKKQ